MENTNEIWFDLIGFDGFYVINELGNVKTKTTTSVTAGRKPSGRVLKKAISNSGYYTVQLRKNKKPYPYLLHRLLAIQFIPNPENKPCVNHIDSNRLNNKLNNLEWVTYSENNSHAHKFGGQKIYIGEKHSQNVLTEKDVLEIRNTYVKGIVTQIMLANKYGCTRGAIQGVLTRKTWKHI